MPATIGGAINLTPNVLRILDHFGLLPGVLEFGCPCEKVEIFSVVTGQKLADLPFGNVQQHGYSSLRICRKDLQQLLLDAIGETDVTIHYNKRLVGVKESEGPGEEFITAIFEDGTSVTGDLLLGCDGVHSAVRSKFVEPSRVPTYSGVSAAYGIIPTSVITKPIPFEATALNTSRNGCLIASYCNAEKTATCFVAAIKVAEQQGPDGWLAYGKVVDNTCKALVRNFESAKLPYISQMTNAVEELFFYPVFVLDHGGRWYRGRALLLGDAVHSVSHPMSFHAQF
jgi:2-polyprenyl-6-methoxyphenol hydroxylase-like FAD-dependent oxidoreductase